MNRLNRDPANRALSLAVLVASRGRAKELGDLLRALIAQTEPADQVVLSVTSRDDLPEALSDEVCTLVGAAGSCRQRNAALDALSPGVDLFAFFDDDYLPSRTALADIRRLFSSDASIVAANGQLLADGVNGPGLSYSAASELIAAFDTAPRDPPEINDGWATYGCNMVFRAEAARARRFDERLPLNGWQEDIDFSSPLRSKGRIVKANAFAGVHRGVKGARVSGKRFGYSQLVNPAYLARKGTMPAQYALKIAAKNLAANLSKSLRPEPWVDRRGRLWGNLLGVRDMALGRIDPERITSL